LVFGITSQATDETLATKLIIKRSFGVGHAANYLRAPSLLVFAAWKNKIPFEPIDQIAMIECVSENWPVCATGSPVQFTSLTEDQALLLRPCLQAALGEDALPSRKECRSIISNMLLSGMLKHPSGGENEDKVKRSSSSSRGNSSSRMGMAVLPDSRDRVEVRTHIPIKHTKIV